MEEKNGHVVGYLFEDSWFFGNSLLSRSKSSKTMVRCNSDPCTSSSSSTKEEGLISDQDHPAMMNSLLRTPSLPLGFGGDRKYQLGDNDDEEEDDDEEGPRMGDLIMQAMPLPKQMPRRRLDRTPSLPACRGKEAVSTVATTGIPNGAGVGRLSRRESLDPSVMLQEKGPIAAMTKLTRRASIDSSMLLPPKSTTSKGTKQSMSNSKNRPHRKLESPGINSQAKPDTKLEKIDKNKSQKSLSDLEVEELQGFKDLGFSFDNEKLSPSVTKILPALQRRASLDSNHVDTGKVRRPYLSESWQRTSSPLSAPPIPKRGDPKAPSSDDMKAQIKFWARAVASNVRQEC
ncbi:uncharacterized protein LOC110737716 [Chenopodium quinoa]|nr:uncharacterized protein LOC110737716 [Chenopodium quinoa]